MPGAGVTEKIVRQWQLWRDTKVSRRFLPIYAVLLAVVFFLLGGYHPETDYRKLQQQLDANEADIRRFSNEISRRNGLLNTLTAREALQKKTIEMLNGRISNLQAQIIREREQSAIYRQILGKDNTTNTDFAIYALEATPEFQPGFWRLNASLVRGGKRKKFSGGYFFEIITKLNGNEYAARRYPEEGVVKLKMDVYYDIEERIELPPDTGIENLRLLIADDKGKTVASAELIDYNGDESNGRNDGPSNEQGQLPQ